MSSTVLDPRLNELVAPDAEPERIATGYVFTEGPVWHMRDQALIFSDVYGDAMYRWTQGRVEVLRAPSANANGNTLNLNGELVTCEQGGRRVSLTRADGSIEALVSHYQGKRLNSPNDVICTDKGDLIFTDPPYGLRQPDGSFLPGDLGFCGVYRVSPSGELTLLVDDFERPNGLVLTDDESRPFIADTQHHHVRVFDLDESGALKNGRVFVTLTYRETQGLPDGMKLDSRGNLYIAGNTEDGVWVFSPDGDLLGFIPVGETPANLAWGGPDWSTLFVTARTSVYRVPMLVRGQPVRGAA